MKLLSTFDRRCYWLLLIVTINVPGFTSFDPTNRTHNFGLFNRQSISHIVLTLLVGAAAFLFFVTRRSYAAMPLVRKRMPLLIALYILFLCTALPWPAKDVALSLYRLFEWALALALVIGLFASSPERTDKLSSELLFRISATIILIVAAVAVISPALALASINGDTGFIQYRFGGSVYPPNTVGTLAAIALYYVFLFHGGARRLIESAFFGAVLVFTYSRGALLAFVLSFFLFNLVFGKPLARLLNILGALVAAGAALAYEDRIIALLSRGRSSGSLTAASGRLAIWAAGWKMFLERPLLGWGFIAGVKRHIPDYYFNPTFQPPHLHNDLLQAIASGGVVAGLLMLAIFLSSLVQGFRHVNASLWQQFLLFALIQVLFHAGEGPVLSGEYQPVGACALICLTSLALVQRYGLPQEPPKLFVNEC